ncbi:M1 family metallopeptidase [Crocinitomicaceae bacterium CZZ-1]|uniref:M1 family metallopeptidase n=1 Tax=Taishania pollutisoli TaxID=2766479 RepID=A0A8J6PKA4_9FLAO|nr:M1 family metallopeptidase [Taishania pollutisoli]MBC9813401.1 M1 family metallopeptidase [Taishania pollutisoli]
MLRILLLLLVPLTGFSQFTFEDTLKGSMTPERSWWDVQHYAIVLRDVNAVTKSIKGTVTIDFKVVEAGKHILQIDLQHPLVIDSATTNRNGTDEQLSFKRITSNVYHLAFPVDIDPMTYGNVTIHYSGTPVEAKNAPWDGGVVWTTDKSGNPFIVTACQGIGASAWWPCKDHGADEPDAGALISVTTPSQLMNISNGQLIENRLKNDTRTTVWEVKNPINIYGINFNIGNYTSWDSIYIGEKGELNMQFYVLRENLAKSKLQFRDAFRMMKAFEYWFGPYPFYEDGYKLVEVPYLGMEHQSSVTYGNGYKNGYKGTDLSATGWGLKWDFIIVHESGHEWFANNITCEDNADMWIHESFTTYSEGLFTEFYYGKDAGANYLRGIRKNILNDRPIIGEYGVNHPGSYDMYYKGANMLHTLRQVVNNDEQWRQLLRELNVDFYHQTVTTADVERYIGSFLKMDLSAFFDQYLRTTKVPQLETIRKGNKIRYRWSNCVEGFRMPVDVNTEKGRIRLYPTKVTQIIKVKNILIDENYYVKQVQQ